MWAALWNKSVLVVSWGNITREKTNKISTANNWKVVADEYSDESHEWKCVSVDTVGDFDGFEGQHSAYSHLHEPAEGK